MKDCDPKALITTGFAAMIAVLLVLQSFTTAEVRKAQEDKAVLHKRVSLVETTDCFPRDPFYHGLLMTGEEMSLSGYKEVVPQSMSSVRKTDILSDRSDSSLFPWMTYTATYYTNNQQDCGNVRGVTRSGRHVEDGITIAVDPNYIPLGAWVEVKYPDGHIEKRRADDTGGAIHGQHIDIYKAGTEQELLQLGKIYVKLRVLSLPKKGS